MSAEDSLSSRQLGMISEAVRRDTAKQHGIAHDAPNAPQVTELRPHDENRDRYHPNASHHITVTYDTPEVTHNHVYGVNTANEYMHNHTHAHILKTTGRAVTQTWTPGKS